MENAFYSPDQVALQLGLHVKTVRNYVREGRLRAVRIGKQYRIASQDLASLTGQPAPESESASRPLPLHMEVSSIVEIDGVAHEAATRLNALLLGAANAQRGHDQKTRVEVIYTAARNHVKIILIGEVEDTAAYLNLINQVIRT
jgi:excisionase family DNA binding protein